MQVVATTQTDADKNTKGGREAPAFCHSRKGGNQELSHIFRRNFAIDIIIIIIYNHNELDFKKTVPLRRVS